MAQGKLKVKTKLPQNVKSKKQSKGNAVTKRSNRPIKPKKKQHEETQKLKQIISKRVNKAVEEEIRARSGTDNKKLSRAQQAVVDYHSKVSQKPVV